MRIGELSRTTGVSTRALRYYEEHQLLASTRLRNGYRDYAEDAPAVVSFIQDMFRAGLSSSLVRDALTCLRDDIRDPDQVARLRARVVQVRDHLEEQERQIARQRRALEAYLAAADSCDGATHRTGGVLVDEPTCGPGSLTGAVVVPADW